MEINFTITDVEQQYRTPFLEKDVIGAHGASDTVRIHWDIITVCDLHCSYCYARVNEQWNDIPSKDKIDATLANIKKIDKEVEVILLGGEPTLSPSYFYILDQLDTYDNVVSLAVLSNAQKKFTPEWVEKHTRYKNFFFNITYHPNDSDFEKTKEAILLCNKEQLVVNIMMLGPKFNEPITAIIDFCKKHNKTVRVNIPFHPTRTTEYMVKKSTYKEWIATFADKFERYLYFKLYNGETYVLNDIDVYLHSLNRFTGWSCKNNNWAISTRSTDLQRMCNGVTDDEFMPCILKACACQGLLSAEKYNTNS